MIGQTHKQAMQPRSNGVTTEAVCTCGTGFYVAGQGKAVAMLARHIALATEGK